MKKDTHFYWLDLIRGLSAMAVFTGHLRIICFRDTPNNLNYLEKAVYFLTGFGHLSVTIFFVLSGFLIIKSINEAVLNNRWNFNVYAKNRLVRLWVVLIPCLFLGLIFAKVGLNYWGDSLIYSNKMRYFISPEVADLLAPSTFIGNAFFLQTILVPVFGFNGSLWSLANEFWYYIIFPLFYFSIISHYQLKYKLIFVAIGILILIFVGNTILLRFPLWLIGGLSYIIANNCRINFLQNKLFLYSLLTVFIGSVICWRINMYPLVFNDYFIGFIFSLLIPFLINAKMNSNLIKTTSIFLSNISYTLYLTHLPFNILITSILGFQNKIWNNHYFIIYLIILVASILYSTFIWFLFEKNTNKIKGWIDALLKNEKTLKSTVIKV